MLIILISLQLIFAYSYNTPGNKLYGLKKNNIITTRLVSCNHDKFREIVLKENK